MKVDPVIGEELRAAHIQLVRNGGTELSAHEGLRRLKLAAALAMLAGRPTVTVDDWRLAGIIVTTSNAVRDASIDVIRAEERQRSEADAAKAGRRRTFELAAEEQHTDTRTTKAVGVIVNYLTNHGGGPLPWRDIHSALGSRHRPVATDARQVAVDRHLIVQTDNGWELAEHASQSA